MTAATGEPAGRPDRRARLREIIIAESLLSGGAFTLASGRASTVFFDMKKTMLDPEGANLIAEAVLDLLEGEDVDFIGGMALGAVPLVAQVCQKSLGRRPLRAFYVRKEAKDHGTEGLIDGHLEDGARVVLFDDVTTTGGSVLKAVAAVRARGCRVEKVISIVDRREGAAENLAAEGIALVPLFTRDDFEDAGG